MTACWRQAMTKGGVYITVAQERAAAADSRR